jgi:serine/threonine protein kinase
MRFEKGNILLSPNEEDNFVQIDNEDFLLLSLSEGFETSKGASSNVFILNDPNGDVKDKVIKICKSPLSIGKNGRVRRFFREIKAFQSAKRNKLRNVIEFFKDGTIEIDNEEFYFFIMEKADDDLASYLENNRFDFTTNQKLTFCVNILNGIKQLHSIGIYHRDIKHDNILIVNEEFKIGDLGLVKFRSKDNYADWTNEKIGPIGWLSPEATNKMLTNKKDMVFRYDCEIDEGSDVFQLGKLFWYVFQGNLPLGQIVIDDHLSKDKEIFQVIFSMLQYEKTRRLTIAGIEKLLEPLKIKYGV